MTLPRTNAGDAILWENCSRQVYDQICDWLEKSGSKLRVEYIGGHAIISELAAPSPLHETA